MLAQDYVKKSMYAWAIHLYNWQMLVCDAFMNLHMGGSRTRETQPEQARVNGKALSCSPQTNCFVSDSSLIYTSAKSPNKICASKKYEAQLPSLTGVWISE